MEYTIYSITIVDKPEFVYVGSTKNYSTRKSKHKTNCLKGYPIKLYQVINENGGWYSCEMKPIDTITTNNRTEALIKEDQWMKTLNATLNQNRAYLSLVDKEDVKAYNKGYVKAYNKEYVKNNYEHLQDLWRHNYEKNKDKILQQRAKDYSFKKVWKELCNIEL